MGAHDHRDPMPAGPGNRDGPHGEFRLDVQDVGRDLVQESVDGLPLRSRDKTIFVVEEDLLGTEPVQTGVFGGNRVVGAVTGSQDVDLVPPRLDLAAEGIDGYTDSADTGPILIRGVDDLHAFRSNPESGLAEDRNREHSQGTTASDEARQAPSPTTANTPMLRMPCWLVNSIPANPESVVPIATDTSVPISR